MVIARKAPLKRTAPKKRKSPNDTAKADVLFSRHIRELARGVCWAAGKTGFECSGYMQCCHIVSRRYRATRWRDYNAVCMCASHHVYYTHHPLEWQLAIGDDVFAKIRDLALNFPPEKAKDALVRLKAL